MLHTAGDGSSEMTDVVARAANDIWLIGYDRIEGQESNHIQRWDGQGFIRVPAPPVPNAGPFGVQEGLASALSAGTLIPGTDELWAVGWIADATGRGDTQVISHGGAG